jgi:hypothetical protein
MSAPSETTPVVAGPTTDELRATVDQLRRLVCGLGLGLSLVSAVVGIWAWKQGRDLLAMADVHRGQLLRLRANQQRLGAVAADLAEYSTGKPELMALFQRHGITVQRAVVPNSQSLNTPRTKP